jgi:hypothetical protein
MVAPVWLEKPDQDKVPKQTEDLLEGLYVLYNTINGRSWVKPNRSQPKSGIVVTIKLEFLDK